MSSGNGSTYANITQKYLKGRIPFRIWLFSSLAGSLSIVVDNLQRQNAILEGFFSILFMNMVITIPLFLAQAHFVGLALQRKPKTARTVMTTILILGWAVTGSVIAYFMTVVYNNGMNSGAMLMLTDFLALMLCWIVLSYLTFKVDRVKKL